MRINPYASFLSRVQRPARYIGGEHLVVSKSDDDPSVKIRVALCFPELYEVGMGHLGYKILYQQLNNEKDIFAERVFAPWMDMEKELKERNIPLVSLESFRPLSEFDVVGFSLQYELTYTNILTMLSLGKISLYSKDRLESEPLVIAGGPCASHPQPLVPFIDLFLIGDGEDIFIKILRHIDHLKREKGLKRDQIKMELSSEYWKKNGVYVYLPSNHNLENNSTKVRRHQIKDLNKYPFPTNSPIPHLTTIFDKFSIEIARGCSEGCRFCFSGTNYRPVRERDVDEITRAVKEGLKVGGLSEASLTSLSTADYSKLAPLVVQLVDDLKEQNISLGVSSLRAYGLCDIVLEKMASLKDYSLTFAPEAGSERMRRVINKNITEEEIIANARKIFSLGWKKMKLYFMIGLPFETDEDVLSIMELAKKIKDVGIEMGIRKPELTVSVSSFVPKPHTPFQWAAVNSLEELKRKQELLWGLSKKYKLNFKKHDANVSIFEALMARGDIKFAKVILDSWESGARFDGWDENFKINNSLWQESFRKNGIDIEEELRERTFDQSSYNQFSWSHIDVGVSESFLGEEWLRAQKEIITKPCSKFECHGCGVECDMDEVKKRKELLKVDSSKLSSSSSIDDDENKNNIDDDGNKKSLNIFLSREKRGQNIGQRYRLKFAKIGPLSFISHLDLQKVIARIFKRAQIKTLYTEGFNLRPLLSFGPALPIGLHSLHEYIDVRTYEFWDDEKEKLKVLQLLQDASEEGLIFYDITQIDKRDASIQEAIISVEYLIPISGAIDNIENIFLNFDSSAKEFIVDIKIVDDCKKFILDVNALTLLEKQIILDKKIGILLKANYSKGVSVKPNYLLKFFAEKNFCPEGIIKIQAYF
ncbi:MAG: TIGR03960 family B12-binding radical SAM protein [Oligoflexia bacterium]|nr:TIGR03960 family B12-binding radical SAM protein [Oligoflexia bacterium]